MNVFQILFMLMAVMVVKTDGKSDQTAYQKRTGKIAHHCIKFLSSAPLIEKVNCGIAD